MLANTIEVQLLSGQTVGLIVLPSHPLRLAWHHSYDTLLPFFRYEAGISAKKLKDIMEAVDGAHFPAFLPGLKPGESFVFGDTLGFYTVAMVSDHDREPKSSIAILAKALFGGKEDVAPSIGKTTSDVLAEEISRYIVLHPDYELIRVHALRSGDGMTIGRAMGTALEHINKQIVEIDDEESPHKKSLAFMLELFSTKTKAGIVGKFFSGVSERKRSGSGYLPEQDRWILEYYTREGNVTLPLLSWAKRDKPEPETSAHLSVAFDTFDSQVVHVPLNEVETKNPIEVYGLVLNLVRDFSFTPRPIWRTFLSTETEGEKHPVARGLSERLTKMHGAIMKATAKNLGGSPDSWPTLITEIASEKEESIRILHKLSDWVITIDRNAGVEYFDSPKEKSAIYDAYIIDCVPEREDTGFLQLVTSTSNFDEIVNLLDTTLAEMGLSSSPRNCLFLLNELKGLSGRFAMRLSGSGNQSQEMIALALTHAHCHSHYELENAENWLSLKEGFFVPLDDVPYLLDISKNTEDADNYRSDLLYVTAPRRGGLQIAFVEVKFRRYLKTARSVGLIETINRQLKNSRQRWEDRYGLNSNTLEKSVRRSWLSRVLKFYANKGRRHYLSEEAYQQIMKELDRLIRESEKYPFSLPEDQSISDRGYIFCPEYSAIEPTSISFDGQPPVLLFGAAYMPDSPIQQESTFKLQSHQETNKKYEVILTEIGTDNIDVVKSSEAATTIINLGNEPYSQELVEWTITINSNPHLMIVGLPGMGKTTSLINISMQMIRSGITPIVFSYHEDIDMKLSEQLQNEIQYVDYAGLGFNPLQVANDSPLAYIDNVSMLRDIFSSIFPDFGEIQLAKLREALKQSYLDKGWEESGDSQNLDLPEFQTFFDILKGQPKQDRGLISRLSELDDYGFFRNTSGARSLLDSSKPALIRIHRTQNEVLQRAFSMFVLHNLYKGMFQRGVQSQITHAILFDEAHRAAKLKLLPTMVKECRKYGIAFVIASQEARDFDPSLFNVIANYLVLRLTENDAKVLAKIMTTSDQVNRYTDRIKQMPKYHALFFGEGRNRPIYLKLGTHS